MQNSVSENYVKIKESLPGNVLLVAVSKTKPIEDIKNAVLAGCMDFGENKAQELCVKYELMPNLNWHFIGRLQKNKVRLIVGKTCLIHSVDSLDLAIEINKRAAKLDLIQDILIQVNVAKEPQKGGVFVEDLDSLYQEILKLSNVRVRGLMQVAPDLDNKEEVRKYFHKLNTIFMGYKFDILSMGMSDDYHIALEEGSNCVRIGSAIFGRRNYI